MLKKYELYYLKGARAITDCPTSPQVLISQRRRWINGANFSQFYVLIEFFKICKTRHSRCKKFWISLFYIYYLMNSLFSYATLGMFYFCYSIVIRSFWVEFTDIEILVEKNSIPAIILQNIYLLVLSWVILISAFVDVKRAKNQIIAILIISGVLMYIFLALACCYFYSNYKYVTGLNSNLYVQEEVGPTDSQLYIAVTLIGILLLSLTVPMFLQFQCNGKKTCFGFFSYLFLMPFYMNVMIIYAFTNIHDVTWGNRETEVGKDVQKMKQRFKEFRYKVYLCWLTVNLGLSYTFSFIYRRLSFKILVVFTGIIAFTVFFRLLASILYRFKNCLCKRKNIKIDVVKIKNQWEPADRPNILEEGLMELK